MNRLQQRTTTDPISLATLYSYILNLQPPLTDYWQGRETELAELRGYLSDPTTRLVGIKAAEGYGKSALAAKLCEGLEAPFFSQLGRRG